MHILYISFIPTIFCKTKKKKQMKGGKIYSSPRGKKNLIQRHLLGNEKHDFGVSCLWPLPLKVMSPRGNYVIYTATDVPTKSENYFFKGTACFNWNVYIWGKYFLIIFSSDISPKRLYSQYYFLMGNESGNTQTKFKPWVLISKVGSWVVKIWVQNSHMQMSLITRFTNKMPSQVFCSRIRFQNSTLVLSSSTRQVL